MLLSSHCMTNALSSIYYLSLLDLSCPVLSCPIVFIVLYCIVYCIALHSSTEQNQSPSLTHCIPGACFSSLRIRFRLLQLLQPPSPPPITLLPSLLQKSHPPTNQFASPLKLLRHNNHTRSLTHSLTNSFVPFHSIQFNSIQVHDPFHFHSHVD